MLETDGDISGGTRTKSMTYRDHDVSVKLSH
ncbi:hypothetical protein Rcae01_05535 [Novipirellula caenicola]|uniref:Uncharacterized protein n=1 Tax=Novipirellula caenicola TaxID=1536901 RepID=A0ABP9VY18_9BACT